MVSRNPWCNPELVGVPGAPLNFANMSASLRVAEEKFRRIPSKGWAEMIRKVYDVDPLACPDSEAS